MKVSDLEGTALDWAVAKCEAIPVDASDFSTRFIDVYAYSTDWSLGGPIIERECIAIYASGACSTPPKNPDYWVAEILATSEMITQYGPTPLIAALRCYVASKLGDEIEIPEELLK